MGDLQALLAARLEELATDLMGPPNSGSSRSRTWRWNNKGSAALEMRGPKRGAFHDFESGAGGGPIQFIIHAKRCSRAAAVHWAIQWLGFDATTSAPPDTAADIAARAAERARVQAEHDAEDAAEKTRKIARARALWAGATPIAGTVAERYLTATRGIPAPAAWPDHVRFHRSTRSLIMAATDADGTIRAVQRVHLDADAQKAPAAPDRPTKVTNGPMDGAAVRLPGDPDGPLLIAEGPEDGFSVWATGFETWIGLGISGVAGMVLPMGRPIVVCRNDDPKFSPADRSINKAVVKWRAEGLQVAIATPWPFRRYDRSDFNDLVKVDGAAGVRSRIDAALNPNSSLPERLLIKVVRNQLNAAATKFFTEARQWTEDLPTPVRVIKVTVGSGKTTAALTEALGLLRSLRSARSLKPVVVAVPRHVLGDELVTKFTTMADDTGLVARVWRGIEAVDLDAAGKAMCQNLEAALIARDALLDIQDTTCRRRAKDGTVQTCAFYEACGYQKQRRAKADLWIIAHELLLAECPKAIGQPAAVLIDEQFWGATLQGVHGRPSGLSVDELAAPLSPAIGEGSEQKVSRQRLEFLRARLVDVLREHADGSLTAEAFDLSGILTLDMVHEARRLEWGRMVKDPGLRPGQSLAERRETAKRAAVNATIPRFAAVWDAVDALMADGGPQQSGWASLAFQDTDSGRQRVLILKGRQKIRAGWNAPILHLDANANMQIIRELWPETELLADLHAAAPHQHIRQVTDSAYALSALTPLTEDSPGYTKAEAKRRAKNLRNLHAVLCREARRYGDAPVLVVAQKAVKEALAALGNLPANVELAHHNGVSGSDRWKKVRAIFIVGRTQPAPAAVERIAEALTGRGVEHIPGWYPRVATVRHTSAGLATAEADRHPDLICEAIRSQCCEAELVQIIGRGRGVDRTADTPLDILMLVDTPIELPVEGTINAADLEPTIDDLQLAAGGVALSAHRDVAEAYEQELGTTANAVKCTRKRQRAATEQGGSFPYYRYRIGERPPLLRKVTFQRTGESQQPVSAVFDPRLVSDVAAWLSERLGALAWCQVEEEMQPDPAVIRTMEQPTMPNPRLTPAAPANVMVRLALEPGFRIAVPLTPTSSDPNAGVHAVQDYLARRRHLLVPPVRVGATPFGKFLDHAPGPAWSR